MIVVERGDRRRSFEIMTAQQNVAFDSLVSAWMRREDLRNAGAEINELGRARIALDAARAEMAAALAA